jgi:hypothetical protein
VFVCDDLLDATAIKAHAVHAAVNLCVINRTTHVECLCTAAVRCMHTQSGWIVVPPASSRSTANRASTAVQPMLGLQATTP